MKRVFVFLLSFILLMTAIPAYSQQNSPQEMWIYMTDGTVNGFRCSLVDSMLCSKVGIDGNESSDYVVQEVWMADSVYRIPLSLIDSIAFTTPAPIYKSDIKVLDKAFTDYILSIDSTAIRVSLQCPTAILPQTGDKIALTLNREDLPRLFNGTVTMLTRESDCLVIECSFLSPLNVYDRFYTTFSSEIISADDPVTGDRARKVTRTEPVDRPVTIGPIPFYYTNGLPWELDDLTASYADNGLSATSVDFFSVDGTFSLRSGRMTGYLAIDNLIWDCSVSLSGTSVIETDLQLCRKVSVSKDIDIYNVKIPIHPELGLVLDVKGGISFGLEGKLMLETGCTITDKIAMTFNLSNNPLKKHNMPSKITKSTPDISIMPMAFSGESKLNMGIFEEYDLALVDSRLDRLGARFDQGVELDIVGKMTSANYKDRLTNSNAYTEVQDNCFWKLRPYYTFSCLAGIGSLEGSITVYEEPEKNLTVYESKFLPFFSNLDRHSDVLTADVDGNVYPPVPVGFIIFDQDDKQVMTAYCEENYSFLREKSMDDYEVELPAVLKRTRAYKAYPLVRLFGLEAMEMLAEPMLSIEPLKPVTEDIENLTSKSVTLAGHIEGDLDDLNDSCKYGFIYGETDKLSSQNGTMLYASIDKEGRIRAAAHNLTGGRHYYYRAFLSDGDDYIYGEINDFTTPIPVEIVGLTLDNASFRPSYYEFNNKTYDFKYDCTTHIKLTNANGLDDWGYIYEAPDGSLAKVSCMGQDTDFADARYAYCRNELNAVIVLYPYVKYTNEEEISIGESERKEFNVGYSSDKSIKLTNCEIDEQTAHNSEYQGQIYTNCTTLRFFYMASGAYYQSVKVQQSGSGWKNWNTHLKPDVPAQAADGTNVLTVNYYYNDKELSGEFFLQLTGGEHGSVSGLVKLMHNGKVFTGCQIVQSSMMPSTEFVELHPASGSEEDTPFEQEINYVDGGSSGGFLKSVSFGGRDIMNLSYDAQNRLSAWMVYPDEEIEVIYGNDGTIQSISTDEGYLKYSNIQTDDSRRRNL